MPLRAVPSCYSLLNPIAAFCTLQKEHTTSCVRFQSSTCVMKCLQLGTCTARRYCSERSARGTPLGAVSPQGLLPAAPLTLRAQEGCGKVSCAPAGSKELPHAP